MLPADSVDVLYLTQVLKFCGSRLNLKFSVGYFQHCTLLKAALLSVFFVLTCRCTISPFMVSDWISAPTVVEESDLEDFRSGSNVGPFAVGGLS